MDIPRTPIEDNPRLEEMAIDVMAALQRHKADLGEAMDIFTNALIGVLAQYPKEAHEELIEIITHALREGAKENDLTDYSEIINQRNRPN